MKNNRAVAYLVSVFVCLWCFLPVAAVYGAEAARWFKGNTHCHSFWSDGVEFPEMVADWYKSHGYDFLALSDHDVLMEGERWLLIGREKRQVPPEAVERYLKRFGADWVELRGEGEKREVRLKTFAEVARKLAEPNRFLLVQGEEISDKCHSADVHLNAFNLAEVIRPQHGASVQETIVRNLLAANEQALRLNRPILVHLNHPNWHYSISAEDLAAVRELRFFEVCNAGDDVNHHGDETHPSVEKLWDAANAIRLTELKTHPLYGIGSDDAHVYHPRPTNLGSAWVVVRAAQLSPEALIEAMNRGEFYASTGVVLESMEFDEKKGELRVAVKAEPGVHYTIEFVGTLQGAPIRLENHPSPPPENKPAETSNGRPSPANKEQPPAPVIRYSPEVGKVLAKVEGVSAVYRLTGEELYVRAVIRSNRAIANAPPTCVQVEQAWTQPVGWQKYLPATP